MDCKKNTFLTTLIDVIVVVGQVVFAGLILAFWIAACAAVLM